jgi:hypothetical protein
MRGRAEVTLMFEFLGYLAIGLACISCVVVIGAAFGD